MTMLFFYFFQLMEYTGITSANRFQGNALMPLSSLMNFSCFQNTLKQFKKNHVVIYARFPIKKGEQVIFILVIFYKESI